MLYLRVMYYVISGVSLITDEVTRNYYFLQLKQDVVEGRISCDPKQAVILANYSRQAEYGNYQDRHTVDYLKTLLSFPKHLIEAGLLEALTEEVIQHHDEVHNITQGEYFKKTWFKNFMLILPASCGTTQAWEKRFWPELEIFKKINEILSHGTVTEKSSTKKIENPP